MVAAGRNSGYRPPSNDDAGRGSDETTLDVINADRVFLYNTQFLLSNFLLKHLIKRFDTIYKLSFVIFLKTKQLVRQLENVITP